MDYVSSTLSAFNVNEDTLPLTFTVIIDDYKVVDIILAPIKESCLANHSYKSHKGMFTATKTYYLTVKSLGEYTIYEYNSSFGVLSSSCSDYTTKAMCSKNCGDASGESYMCKWDTDSGTDTCKLDLDHTCPTPGPSPDPAKLCKICTDAGLNYNKYTGQFNAVLCIPSGQEGNTTYNTTQHSAASFYCSIEQPCGTGVSTHCTPYGLGPNWNCGNCASFGTETCGTLLCTSSPSSNNTDSTYLQYFPKSAVTVDNVSITIDGLAAVNLMGNNQDLTAACSLKYPLPLQKTATYGYLTPITVQDITTSNNKPIIYKVTSVDNKIIYILLTDACGACSNNPQESNWRIIDISCKAMIKLGAKDLTDSTGPIGNQPACNRILTTTNQKTGYGLLSIKSLEPVLIKKFIFNNGQSKEW